MLHLTRLLIICLLSLISYFRTDGFSPAIIQDQLTGFLQNDEKIIQVLSQPFTYLGRGRQCFVFQSEDQRYVIKFFNQNYFKVPFYAFLFGKKEIEKRRVRRFFYENSYPLALDNAENKILVLHKSLSKDLPTIQVKDQASRFFQIDLNTTPFVLQEKGIPLSIALEKIYADQGLDGLKKIIDQLIQSIRKRIERKIADKDSDILNNWGLINGELFHLDPGRLTLDTSLEFAERRKEELHSSTRKLKKWLDANDLKAKEYLEKKILSLEEYLEKYRSNPLADL